MLHKIIALKTTHAKKSADPKEHSSSSREKKRLKASSPAFKPKGLTFVHTPKAIVKPRALPSRMYLVEKDGKHIMYFGVRDPNGKGIVIKCFGPLNSKLMYPFLAQEYGKNVAQFLNSIYAFHHCHKEAVLQSKNGRKDSVDDRREQALNGIKQWLTPLMKPLLLSSMKSADLTMDEVQAFNQKYSTNPKDSDIVQELLHTPTSLIQVI